MRGLCCTLIMESKFWCPSMQLTKKGSYFLLVHKILFSFFLFCFLLFFFWFTMRWLKNIPIAQASKYFFALYQYSITNTKQTIHFNLDSIHNPVDWITSCFLICISCLFVYLFIILHVCIFNYRLALCFWNWRLFNRNNFNYLSGWLLTRGCYFCRQFSSLKNHVIASAYHHSSTRYI